MYLPITNYSGIYVDYNSQYMVIKIGIKARNLFKVKSTRQISLT